MDPISSIEATINGSLESILSFDPKKKSYEVEVPEDCFGMLLRLKYEPDFYISITADKDAGRFGYAELDAEMGDYIAGQEIPYYEYYDGYIVRLDKREACYDEDLKVNISIRAGSAERGEAVYEIHLLRRSNKAVREKFQEGSFYDEEFGITMPYELYVPGKYDPKKKYPIVIGLHGTGEIQEPISAVLKKMQMATIWAEDAEKGHNECIVLAPQCTIRYNDEDNWTSLNQFIHGHSNSPFWPMPQLKVVWKLLEQLKQDYSIDDKRQYLTGVSSGAFGAYVLAMEHPGAFAGLVVACGAANPQRIGELKGTPMWIFHAEDDPLIVPSFTLKPTVDALDAAGIGYKLTSYPKGSIFWQSAHFCWEAVYKEKEMRDWLVAQKAGSAGSAEEGGEGPGEEESVEKKPVKRGRPKKDAAKADPVKAASGAGEESAEPGAGKKAQKASEKAVKAGKEKAEKEKTEKEKAEKEKTEKEKAGKEKAGKEKPEKAKSAKGVDHSIDAAGAAIAAQAIAAAGGVHAIKKEKK